MNRYEPRRFRGTREYSYIFYNRPLVVASLGDIDRASQQFKHWARPERSNRKLGIDDGSKNGLTVYLTQARGLY